MSTFVNHADKLVTRHWRTKLAVAEETIAAAKTAAMANVRSIAEEAAIAIVARLTGTAPSKAAAAAAVDAAIKR